MRVLVTGASGFIGSHTTAALQRAGHTPVAFVRSVDKARRVLAAVGATDVELALGDLGEPETLSDAAHNVEAIVHTAADVAVAGNTGPVGDINVAGTTAVIAAARATGIERVIYTSTLAAFLPSTDDVITSDSQLAEPLSAYGRSKRDAELVVRAAQDDGLGVVTLYPGGVYGPIAPALDSGFAAILGAMQFGMMCPPGGMGVVDVRDLSDVIVELLDRPVGAARYMAGGHFMDWTSWTHALSEAAGVEIAANQVSAQDMAQMGRDFDAMRAEQNIETPLSEEAAIIMSAGRPTDDSALLAGLSTSWRPVVDTMRDTVEYLRDIGQLPRLP